MTDSDSDFSRYQRPDRCMCSPPLVRNEFPCFWCSLAGFETPNPEVPERADDEIDPER